MTLKSEHLYFIAIVPPDDVSGRITDLKHYMSQEYGSRHALRSPPHVTLHMPFRWKMSKRPMLEKALEELAGRISSFEMKLRGFGSFPPRVIYVDVYDSSELTDCFQKTKQTMRKLNILNASYKDRAFHPHATIAFRDLKKRDFENAWSEFAKKSFEADFTVGSISLLEHSVSDEGVPRWQIAQQYPLSD
jgi:2'-5' RNA ligase